MAAQAALAAEEYGKIVSAVIPLWVMEKLCTSSQHIS